MTIIPIKSTRLIIWPDGQQQIALEYEIVGTGLVEFQVLDANGSWVTVESSRNMTSKPRSRTYTVNAGEQVPRAIQS